MGAIAFDRLVSLLLVAFAASAAPHASFIPPPIRCNCLFASAGAEKTEVALSGSDVGAQTTGNVSSF